MRHYIEVQIPAKTATILDKTTCDLCGKVAKKGNWESSKWEVNQIEVDITMRLSEGLVYPEGGSGTEYRVDICPDCFKTKLIPWLESQGCKAKMEDWDW